MNVYLKQRIVSKLYSIVPKPDQIGRESNQIRIELYHTKLLQNKNYRP